METDVISTNEAAKTLGVTPRRVLAMIEAGKLPAMQMGRFYVIRKADLALVSERKTGRPKKEDAAEASPAAKTLTTRTPAQKKAIAAEQQRRWKGEQLTLPEVSPKKAPAVKAKATKKGGKK